MKASLFIFLLALVQINAIAQDTLAPELTLETDVLNYGTIEFGSEGVKELKLINTGRAPLVIWNVQSSCGCLVSTWPKEPIPPGQGAVIKFKYDTRSGRTRIDKSVTITSNARTPTRVIKVIGTVKAKPAEEEPAPPGEK